MLDLFRVMFEEEVVVVVFVLVIDDELVGCEFLVQDIDEEEEDEEQFLCELTVEI